MDRNCVRTTNLAWTIGLLLATSVLSACAGPTTLIDSPTVNLTGVELADASFSRQTFNLDFDVDNPNPFPLPVRAVNYQVSIDNQKFAGGETEGSFTVPAGGQDDFTIRVDLDVLNTGTQLSSLFRGGMPESINYELVGSLTVDIPFAKPIPFSSTGVIEVQGGLF